MCMSGYGSWSNGKLSYDGNYVNGILEGFGIITSSNKEEIMFKRGIQYGRGKIINAPDTFYVETNGNHRDTVFNPITKMIIIRGIGSNVDMKLNYNYDLRSTDAEYVGHGRFLSMRQYCDRVFYVGSKVDYSKEIYYSVMRKIFRNGEVLIGYFIKMPNYKLDGTKDIDI